MAEHNKPCLTARRYTAARSVASGGFFIVLMVAVFVSLIAGT